MSKNRKWGIALIGGIVGGLSGTWVMSEVRTAMLPPGKPTDWSKREHELRGRGTASDDATEKVANQVARTVLKRNLRKQEKPVAGLLVHYGTGTSAAIIYTIAVELVPPLDASFGLPLGLSLWLGDETLIPALGLTTPPQHMPTSSHLYNLTSHLVYGLTTDAVRRFVVKLLA